MDTSHVIEDGEGSRNTKDGSHIMRTTKSRLLASTAVLGVLAAAMSAVVFSAFSATTENAGNSFATGSITLTDNDSGSALFNVSGADANDTYTRCIKVTYASTGSVNASVKLYGTTGGTGLDAYLDVAITRGTGDAADCSDFAGATSIYSGTLQAFPDNYAGGTNDTDASWSNGETATYRVAVTVQDNNAAQGLTATQTFTWEARSI